MKESKSREFALAQQRKIEEEMERERRRVELERKREELERHRQDMERLRDKEQRDKEVVKEEVQAPQPRTLPAIKKKPPMPEEQPAPQYIP